MTTEDALRREIAELEAALGRMARALTDRDEEIADLRDRIAELTGEDNQ